jgi:hypothetical protein
LLWVSAYDFDMDGDPAVEPELDGFSRVLPLPYRVALIIVLGTYSALNTSHGYLQQIELC